MLSGFCLCLFSGCCLGVDVVALGWGWGCYCWLAVADALQMAVCPCCFMRCVFADAVL